MKQCVGKDVQPDPAFPLIHVVVLETAAAATVAAVALQVICHGIPDQRELQDGDIVNVDVTAYIGGYHGDLNETFTVGKVGGPGRSAAARQHH
jgi:methionine aminopeptidase